MEVDVDGQFGSRRLQYVAAKYREGAEQRHPKGRIEFFRGISKALRVGA